MSKQPLSNICFLNDCLAKKDKVGGVLSCSNSFKFSNFNCSCAWNWLYRDWAMLFLSNILGSKFSMAEETFPIVILHRYWLKTKFNVTLMFSVSLINSSGWIIPSWNKQINALGLQWNARIWAHFLLYLNGTEHNMPKHCKILTISSLYSLKVPFNASDSKYDQILGKPECSPYHFCIQILDVL